MSQSTLGVVPTSQIAVVMEQGRSWEADREAQRLRSEQRAWWVAGAACGTTLLSLVAFVFILPLKTTVPYVIYVDKASGNQEIVNAINDRDVGYRELNEKHWASKYVTSHESYLYTLLQHDYDTVLALSSDEVGRSYARLFEGDQAKDKKFGPHTEERIKIISVVLPPDSSGKAVIRFEKLTRRLNADQAGTAQTFVATMGYEFKPSMRGKEKDLLQNPLGFKVTSYRVDAELGAQGALK